MISPYLIGGMPEEAGPVQVPQTIIEIRPYRNGWQCFEAPGVQPYWTGDSAKADAIGYEKHAQNLSAEKFACLARKE